MVNMNRVCVCVCWSLLCCVFGLGPNGLFSSCHTTRTARIIPLNTFHKHTHKQNMCGKNATVMCAMLFVCFVCAHCARFGHQGARAHLFSHTKRARSDIYYAYYDCSDNNVTQTLRRMHSGVYSTEFCVQQHHRVTMIFIISSSSNTAKL